MRRSAGRCRAMRRSAAFTCLRLLRLRVAGLLWVFVHDRGKLASLTAIVVLLGAGQALQTLHWTRPSGEPVTAALLQGNIEQEMKFSPQRYPAHLRHLRAAGGGDEREADRAAGDRAAEVLPPHRPGGARAPRGRGARERRRPAARRPVSARRGLLQQRGHARRVAAADLPQGRTWCRSASSSRPASAGCCRSCASRCRISAAARRTSRRSRSPASASRSTSATRTCSARRSRGARRGRDAARQRVERRLVRRLARAGAAPADRATARDRDRAHASHRHQYRHHRGDRPRRPRARPPAAVHRGATRGRRAGLRGRDAVCAAGATGRSSCRRWLCSRFSLFARG